MSFETGGSSWKPMIQKTQFSQGYGSSGGTEYQNLYRNEQEPEDSVNFSTTEEKDDDFVLDVNEKNLFETIIDFILKFFNKALQFIGIRIEQKENIFAKKED